MDLAILSLELLVPRAHTVSMEMVLSNFLSSNLLIALQLTTTLVVMEVSLSMFGLT